MKRDPNSPERIALRRLLRRMRIEAGLKQSELAKKIGMNQSFVSKLENGERFIDLIQLCQICDVLDQDVVELIKEFKAKTQEEE